jgi:transcriptional regulator with XRE-family HTH domain
MPLSISNIIKQRREVLNISQETLAELSGVAVRTIKAIESGSTNPTFNTLQQITEVLGLEIKIQVIQPA